MSREAFRATSTLAGFVVRRERLRIAVWIATVVLLVAITVASVEGLYPTQAELDAAAATAEDNAAAIILNGPAQGLDTVGGQVAFQTGTYGLIVMGLMSLFMLGRLTRGEEEAGRAELLRSLPIGAHALPAAALLTVAGMNLLTGAAVTAVGLVVGLPVAGSVVFGVSFALFGLMFAAVTLTLAQVTENTRVVYGLGGLLLGVSFALRAIGDVRDGTISWLSPIGWAQKARPWAGDVWWPLLLLVVAAGLALWAALVLGRRRDLGAGLVQPRTGPARAAASLGHPWGLALRLQRGALVAWVAALAVLAAAYSSVTGDIEDFIEDSEAIGDLFTAGDAGTLVEQFVVMSTRIVALVGAGFAVQATLRLRGEETAGRAEYVLTTPVSRARLAASHLLVAFVGSALVLGAAAVAAATTDAAVRGAGDLVDAWIGAGLAYVPALWLVVGVTFALVGLAPRLSALAWFGVVACFVIGMFGQLLDLPGWLEDLSPFQHVPQHPAADLDPVPFVLLTVVAAALTGLGLLGWRRRDLG